LRGDIYYCCSDLDFLSFLEIEKRRFRIKSQKQADIEIMMFWEKSVRQLVLLHILLKYFVVYMIIGGMKKKTPKGNDKLDKFFQKSKEKKT